MNCLMCGTPLEDGISLCPECGKEYAMCSGCGSHNDTGSIYCAKCGKSLSEETAGRTHSNRSKAKRRRYFSAYIILVFSAALLIGSFLFNNKGLPENIFFIKYLRIYQANLIINQTKEIVTYMDLNSGLHSYPPIKMSEDGKRIFFPGSSGYELAYITQGLFSEKKTVDEEVYSYLINKDGVIVYYCKGLALIRYDMNKNIKTVIDDNFNSSNYYRINPEGTRLLYVKNEALYYCEGNGKPQLIREESGIVHSIIHVSKDLRNLYFLINGKLYHSRNGNEAVPLSDVTVSYAAYYVYDTGELYFADDKSNLYYYRYEKDAPVILVENFGEILVRSNNKPAMIIRQDGVLRAVMKDKIKKIDAEIGTKCMFNNSATKLYYYKNYHAVYSYDLSKNKTALVDTNVYGFSFLKDSDKYICIKQNPTDGVIRLYVEKKLVTTDIKNIPSNLTDWNEYFIISDSDGNILYSKNSEKDGEARAELWVYNGWRSVRITDKCDGIYYISPARIVYIQRDTDKSCKLYLFNGRKSILISDVVNTFLPAEKETYIKGYVASKAGVGYDVSYISFTYR